MRPLRLAIAGSVDDGKSTLLGRLLADTARLKGDELDAVRRASGGTELNLAFFTDGLETERQRGITLDVAWRHLELGGRRVLLADVPGHSELLHNMATGASVADAAVVLVDATRGVQLQTRRHLVMLSGLGVRRVVACLNKLDEVGFSSEVALALTERLAPLGRELNLELTFVPVSALHGDNVVKRSARVAWYEGPPLAEVLAALPAVEESTELRLWAQTHSSRDGWVSVVGPSRVDAGRTVLVTSAGGSQPRPASVLEVSPIGGGRLRLDVLLRRGDWLSERALPRATTLPGVVTWVDASPLDVAREYRVLQPGVVTNAHVELVARRSLETGRFEATSTCGAGDVVEVTVRPTAALVLGSRRALLIDGRGHTVAGCVFDVPHEVTS